RRGVAWRDQGPAGEAGAPGPGPPGRRTTPPGCSARERHRDDARRRVAGGGRGPAGGACVPAASLPGPARSSPGCSARERQRGGDVGMAFAEELRAEGEGLLVELIRLRQVSLLAVDQRQVVQGGGDGGMPLAVELSAEVEGLLVELACLRQVPLGATDLGQ